MDIKEEVEKSIKEKKKELDMLSKIEHQDRETSEKISSLAWCVKKEKELEHLKGQKMGIEMKEIEIEKEAE